MELQFIHRERNSGKSVSSGNPLLSRPTFLGIDEMTSTEIAAAIGFHEQISSEVAFDSVIDGTGPQYRSGLGDLEKTSLTAIPRQKDQKIQRALEWYERDDLIGDLIRVKVDFALTGFTLNCTSSLDALDEIDPDEVVPDGIANQIRDQIREQNIFQKKLNSISQKWDLKAITRTLLEDWFATDSMILYWRTDNPITTSLESDASSPNRKSDLINNLNDIVPLSPNDVLWENSLGLDELRVKIPAALRRRIEEATRKTTSAERNRAIEGLIAQGIGEKWIEAVQNNQPYVRLDPEDGDHWIIRTRGRKHHGLAEPTMQQIFLPLECRKALTEGDFAASYMMKDFIFHISAGEPITQGPLAGQRNNWAKKDDLTGIQSQMNKTSRAFRFYSNHTVKFEFVYPPSEMFDGAKYLKLEQRIYNWAGVTVQIMSGEGGTYATGFLGVKKLISNTIDTRDEIRWIWQEFFDDDSIRPGSEMPDECQVNAVFDEQVLKEPAQLLSELKFLVENEFGNPAQSIRELGRSPEVYRRSSLEARREQQILRIYEPLSNDQVSSGNQSDSNPNGEGPGRPQNPETPDSPMTAVRSGSPVTGQPNSN